MFVRKFKINGIRGIKKSVEFNFAPTTETKFKDNVETFGLERNIDQFNALKQISIIGLNSSGKTSALMAFYAGFELWSNSMMAASQISLLRNIFSENDPIEFEAEVVDRLAKGESTGIVGKYNISFTFDSGVFTKEKMLFTEASKTSLKKEILIYERNSNDVKIFGDKLVSGLSPSSLFFLIRTGTHMNNNWNAKIKKHEIFSQFKVYSKQVLEQDAPISNLTIPKLKTDRKLFLSLLKLYDPNLLDFKINQDNIAMLTIKSGGATKEIRADSKHNILSSGTFAILRSNQAIFQAILTKNIVLYDELGKSAHEGLFRVIIEIFKKTNAQLIFTTHSNKIFEQALRRDQMFSISNNDGEIQFKRISDLENLDPRYISAKKVNQSLGNNPSQDAIIEILETVDELIKDE